jgi:anthranilate/para-aminobenzoate synthase component I
MTCTIEPFALEGLDFEALGSAASAICVFGLQRSREAGISPDYSYFGLEVEPITREQASFLTSSAVDITLASDAAASVPFKGGIFAYLPYDGPEASHVFWLVRDLLILNHRTGDAFLSRASSGKAPNPHDRSKRLRTQSAALSARREQIASPSDDWSIDVGYEKYCAQLATIQARIAAGEIEQAILSLGLSKKSHATAGEIFDELRQRNASPHVFLVRHGATALIGASPAMHLRKEGNLLTVETDAGTRRLGATEEENRAIEHELLSSEKDLEEQRMIVDETIRDLQAIAAGPVKVPVRLEIRRLGSVMHLFTVLEARIAEGLGPIDAVMSCFPPSAVTGAPRHAAMRVIQEVEQVSRGPYGGVLGVIGFDGAVDTAIVLRSACLRDGLVSMRCGGGITHASVTVDEYNECLNKARSIQACVATAESQAVKST